MPPATNKKVSKGKKKVTGPKKKKNVNNVTTNIKITSAGGRGGSSKGGSSSGGGSRGGGGTGRGAPPRPGIPPPRGAPGGGGGNNHQTVYIGADPRTQRAAYVQGGENHNFNENERGRNPAQPAARQAPAAAPAVLAAGRQIPNPPANIPPLAARRQQQLDHGVRRRAEALGAARRAPPADGQAQFGQGQVWPAAPVAGQHPFANLGAANLRVAEDDNQQQDVQNEENPLGDAAIALPATAALVIDHRDVGQTSTGIVGSIGGGGPSDFTGPTAAGRLVADYADDDVSRMATANNNNNNNNNKHDVLRENLRRGQERRAEIQASRRVEALAAKGRQESGERLYAAQLGSTRATGKVAALDAANVAKQKAPPRNAETTPPGTGAPQHQTSQGNHFETARRNLSASLSQDNTGTTTTKARSNRPAAATTAPADTSFADSVVSLRAVHYRAPKPKPVQNQNQKFTTPRSVPSDPNQKLTTPRKVPSASKASIAGGSETKPGWNSSTKRK